MAMLNLDAPGTCFPSWDDSSRYCVAIDDQSDSVVAITLATFPLDRMYECTHKWNFPLIPPANVKNQQMN